MSMKSLNNLRVVVNINALENSDEDDVPTDEALEEKHDINYNETIVFKRSASKKLETPMSSSMKAEIKIIDEKNIQMNHWSTDEMPYTVISHKIEFDRVGHNSVNLMKSEFSLVMDEMLIKKKNCCLIHFSNSDEMQAELFHKHLVNFLNKRLHYQKLTLQNIEVLCRDIDGGGSNIDKEKGKIPYPAGLERSRPIYHNGNQGKQQFYDTQNLLSWILNDHRRKLSHDFKFHHKLQITFHIFDSWRKNLFEVNLDIYNIYLDYMDSKDRNHWHQYMEHMDGKCSDSKCDFMHTGLTISLSRHLEVASDNLCILLFNVPNNPDVPEDNVEIIQMAYATIHNRKKRQRELQVDKRRTMYSSKISNANSLHDIYTANEKTFEYSSSSRGKCGISNSENNSNSLKQNDRRLSLPIISHCDPNTFRSKQIPSITRSSCNINNNNNIMKSECPEDLNYLSSWYRKIDTLYLIVCSFCQDYYKMYFKIHSNLLLHSFDTMPSNESEVCAPFQMSKKDELKLLKIYENYRKAENDLHSLYNELGNMKFNEVLKLYLDTKFYQLNQKTMEWKLKHLNDRIKHLNISLNNVNV